MNDGADNNDSGQKPKRVYGRPFKPGQVTNPGGRPKGWAEFKQACREKDEMTMAVIIDLMLNSPNHSVRLEAAKHIQAMGWGKPTSRTEISGPDGDAIAIKQKSWLDIIAEETKPKP